MEMAENELAVDVAAPAPLLAPIPSPAPATIPIALTGWSPSTIAELEAAGITEVSADHASSCTCQRPCPCTPLHPPWRRPPCGWLHLPPPCPCPCVRTPQRHGTLPSPATSQQRQLPSSRAPPVDRATT